MSTVSKAARAAYEADKAEIEAKAFELARKEAARRAREYKKMISRVEHLLGESVLVTLFPDTEWRILDGGESKDGPDHRREWIKVREKGDQYAPEFLINLAGTWICRRGETWGVKIESVLDIGKAMKEIEEQDHREAYEFYRD